MLCYQPLHIASNLGPPRPLRKVIRKLLDRDPEPAAPSKRSDRSRSVVLRLPVFVGPVPVVTAADSVLLAAIPGHDGQAGTRLLLDEEQLRLAVAHVACSLFECRLDYTLLHFAA